MDIGRDKVIGALHIAMGKLPGALGDYVNILIDETMLEIAPKMIAAQEARIIEVEKAIEAAKTLEMGDEDHILYLPKHGIAVGFVESPLELLASKNVFKDAPVEKAMRLPAERGKQLVASISTSAAAERLGGVLCIPYREALAMELERERKALAGAHVEIEDGKIRIAAFYKEHPSLKGKVETDAPKRDEDRPTDKDKTKHPE